MTSRTQTRPGCPSRSRTGALAAVLALALALLCGCASVGSGSGSGGAPATTGPTASGAPATAASRAVPVRLEIPRIGVDTPVVSLGLNPDGTVAVPPIEANAPAGWYQGSPVPGQNGPAVILGHVTVGQYGNGVFYHLSQLRAGDGVAVVLRDGTTVRFTVSAVKTVSKAHFPTSEVYGNVDRPALRLITCGGPRGSGGYPDNVIVFASSTTAV